MAFVPLLAAGAAGTVLVAASGLAEYSDQNRYRDYRDDHQDYQGYYGYAQGASPFGRVKAAGPDPAASYYQTVVGLGLRHGAIAPR